jgi:hypothetical protein
MEHPDITLATVAESVPNRDRQFVHIV